MRDTKDDLTEEEFAEMDSEEKREWFIEEAHDVDALVAVTVSFIEDPDDPREDMDVNVVSFRSDDMTRSQTYAAKEALDDGVDDLGRRFGSGGPSITGMPVPADLAEALLGSMADDADDDEENGPDDGAMFQ